MSPTSAPARRNFFDHDILGNSNIFFPLTIDRARIRGMGGHRELRPHRGPRHSFTPPIPISTRKARAASPAA